MSKETIITASVRALKLSTAFFDGGPGWKLDADGNLAKDANGNPIYVNAAGKDQSVNGETIATTNAEAGRQRVRAETAEASLKKFEGIADPAAALAALDTVSKIDQKTLIAAGEVDRVRAEVGAQYQTKVDAEAKRANGLQDRLNNTIIGNAFLNSPYVKEKLIIPADVAQSFFGSRLTVDENDKVIGKGADGNPITSNKNMGQTADFDEAIEIMVAGYANRDHILKGDGQSGTGNGGGGGNGAPNGKIIKRSALEQMSPAEQARIAGEVGKGKIQLLD